MTVEYLTLDNLLALADDLLRAQMVANDSDWEPNARQEAYLVIATAFPFPKHNEAARTCKIPVPTIWRWHSPTSRK